MDIFPDALSEDARACFGLITLQVDETIEDDFRRIFPVDIARLHVSRVASGDALTPETIAAMADALPGAARLLPPAVQFDVVAYACTSGTTLIGEERVRKLVQGHTNTKAVTNPLTATVAAFKALGLGRIGIVSPYIPAVAQALGEAFEARDINVADSLCFGEEVEARVARISPSSIKAAARVLAERSQLDGIFLSCTNLRTLDVIADLEGDLGVPVLSSNQTLAWHMACLSGLPLRLIPGALSSSSDKG